MTVSRNDVALEHGEVRVAHLEGIGAGGARLGGAAAADLIVPVVVDLAGLDEDPEAAHPDVADPAVGSLGHATVDDPGRGVGVPGHRRAAGASTGAGRGRRRSEATEFDPDVDPGAVARNICLRLLAERARTRQELAHALRRKGVPDEAASVVLERFGEVGLIDDAAFAGQWVRSRHTVRGLGRHALAVELRRKGVAEEVAGQALSEVDADAEEQRARQLVDRKLRTTPVGTGGEQAVSVRRLAGMLARRGYSAGMAYRVVREALSERDVKVEELGHAAPPLVE